MQVQLFETKMPPTRSTTLDDLAIMMRQMGTKLDSSVETINKKIEDNHMELSSKITGLYSAVHEEINCINNDLKTLKEEISNMKRRSILNDVIVTGIPYLQNENFLEIFGNICNSIGFSCSAAEVNNIYRLKSNTNNKPIIIKFVTNYARSGFMRSYFKYKSLSLNDIGLDSPNRIYINSCLTMENQKIFKDAIGLKKKGTLAKVTTRNGFVWVAKTNEFPPALIKSYDELKTFFSN